MSPAARRTALVLAALAAIAGSSAAATRVRVFRGAHEREIFLERLGALSRQNQRRTRRA